MFPNIHCVLETITMLPHKNGKVCQPPRDEMGHQGLKMMTFFKVAGHTKVNPRIISAMPSADCPSHYASNGTPKGLPGLSFLLCYEIRTMLDGN